MITVGMCGTQTRWDDTCSLQFHPLPPSLLAEKIRVIDVFLCVLHDWCFADRNKLEKRKKNWKGCLKRTGGE